ncbi:MAG: PocR ligand-binding domain-containing protein [Oscillospiraceae bacterium]
MKKQIELMTVLQELYNISGFKITVFDKDFNQIAAYPDKLCSFCELLRQNPDVMDICTENDHCALKIATESEDVYVYRCKFGLYEAVAPLYSFGRLTGYLMMGQSLDTLTTSRDYVFEKASPYVADKEALRKATGEINLRSKEQILSCISIMDICANYITLTDRLNMKDADLAEEIKKHIDRNFQKKISIDMLCSKFFCSKATLINTFKNKYGKTVNIYLTEVRIDAAKKMLARTQMSIKEVAVKCGFSDQNYFSKVFSKTCGTTPSDFRSAGC